MSCNARSRQHHTTLGHLPAVSLLSLLVDDIATFQCNSAGLHLLHEVLMRQIHRTSESLYRFQRHNVIYRLGDK